MYVIQHSAYLTASAVGWSPSCALSLYDIDVIFTPAMPQGTMMQAVQN